MANRYVPPGSLIYLVQKGMMLYQIEKHAEDSINLSQTAISNDVTPIIDSLRQSMKMNHEASENTKKLRLLNPESEAKGQGDHHLLYQLNSECSLFLEGHKKPVVFAEWDQKSENFATASLDGNCIVWTTDNQSSEHVLYKDKTEFHRLSHNAPIVSLQFALGSSLLASLTTDGHIIVSENGDIKGTWDVEAPVSDIKFFNVNSFYVSSNNCVTMITLSETETAKPEKVAEMKGEIILITLSHKSRYLAIGDDKGNFSVINNKQKVICTHDHLHDSSICSISPAVKSDSFATGGCDGFVKLVKVYQSEPIVFDGHAKASYLVAYDLLDRYIASTGPDRILSIWNIKTNQIVYRFFVNEQITYMLWSPNGNFLSVCLYSS